MALRIGQGLKRLIIVTGQEGAGKSTVVRALGPEIPNSAQVDAEDVARTNPWVYNDEFIALLWNNVLALVENFWSAGFSTVIAGSFLLTREEYLRFSARLPDDVSVVVVQLLASKETRDRRRIERAKPTRKAWRDDLDRRFPDRTLCKSAGAYDYIGVRTDDLTVRETIAEVIRGLGPSKRDS